MDPAVLHEWKAAAAAVFAGHPVLAAYAFGSRVSGAPRADSDLDIAYFTGATGGPANVEPLTLSAELHLATLLARRLGVEVDLRCFDQASLEARGRILEEGLRIYSGDDVRRVALERATLSYYHDYKDTFLRMRAERLRRKASGGVL